MKYVTVALIKKIRSRGHLCSLTDPFLETLLKKGEVTSKTRMRPSKAWELFGERFAEFYAAREWPISEATHAETFLERLGFGNCYLYGLSHEALVSHIREIEND